MRDAEINEQVSAGALEPEHRKGQEQSDLFVEENEGKGCARTPQQPVTASDKVILAPASNCIFARLPVATWPWDMARTVTPGSKSINRICAASIHVSRKLRLGRFGNPPQDALGSRSGSTSPPFCATATFWHPVSAGCQIPLFRLSTATIDEARNMCLKMALLFAN